ncbi:MAG TPA: DUF4142 domain-containing protein [Steroidobacteraceae bacterium]
MFFVEQRACRSLLRKFGAMMVEDHGASNKKLAALARSKGITLPTAPNDAHARDSRFRANSGEERSEA